MDKTIYEIERCASNVRFYTACRDARIADALDAGVDAEKIAKALKVHRATIHRRARAALPNLNSEKAPNGRPDADIA